MTTCTSVSCPGDVIQAVGTTGTCANLCLCVALDAKPSAIGCQAVYGELQGPSKGPKSQIKARSNGQ